jgi:hypothetical protein
MHRVEATFEVVEVKVVDKVRRAATVRFGNETEEITVTGRTFCGLPLEYLTPGFQVILAVERP